MASGFREGGGGVVLQGLSKVLSLRGSFFLGV